MKVYYICKSRKKWEEHGSEFGVSHGVKLSDGTFVFHTHTETFHEGHRREFEKDKDKVTALPSLLDPTPIGASVAAQFPKELNAAKTDTMYTLAKKLTALSPVFDPDV